MKAYGIITTIFLLILLALITCTCSGVRLTSGSQTFVRPIDYSIYFGKPVKPMYDVMECVTLRIDDQGSLSWQVVRPLTWQPYPVMHATGFCPSPVPMLRKCLPTKSCQYPSTIRSSSNQSKTVWIDLKQNLLSEFQHQNLQDGVSRARTNQKIYKAWTPQSTGRTPVTTPMMERNLNSLYMMNQGKWERPNNILNNWRVTKTTLRLGSRVIGKCMMGSTSNALDKGGENFKKLYRDSNIEKRNKNGQTSSGLYSLFIPMEWNYEGFIDEYGYPVFDTPDNEVKGPFGEYIDIGILEHWQNEVDGLKNDPDALNEFYRQFPRTEEHAFRDETKNSIFNLTKIYEQIDYNEDISGSSVVNTGSFQWVNGIKDSQVIFYPDPKGRFKISWIPPAHLQNRVVERNGYKTPGNEHMGAFGCDSYDISGTVDGLGSKGALHGLTKFSMEDAPPNHFFLEYIARPQTAEMFFEDVLMALIFYGMPILAENNKPRLLYYLRRRGYRGYSMNRPDRSWNKLSTTEKEIGGIPNSSEDIRQAHAAAIEMYIQEHVGLKTNGNYGDIYFNRTLNDWSRFDINNRTKFDAAISSGLAVMACNRNLYAPNVKKEKQSINISFSRYENQGNFSKIIK